MSKLSKNAEKTLITEKKNTEYVILLLIMCLYILNSRMDILSNHMVNVCDIFISRNGRNSAEVSF